MAYTWPDIRGAIRENFEQFPRVDPTIRRISLDGRPRNRRGPQPLLYGFNFTLRMLSAVEKELLEDFEATVRVGGETFTWTDERPSESTGGIVGIWTVRLAEPLTFELDGDGCYYQVQVSLNQEYE